MIHALHEHVAAVAAGVAAVAVATGGALVAVLVSDGIIIAAVTATGALLVSLVGLVGTLVTVRLSREAKTLAERTHDHVTEPTIPDRLDRLDQQFAEHVVVGTSALGKVRRDVGRLARAVERMTPESEE